MTGVVWNSVCGVGGLMVVEGATGATIRVGGSGSRNGGGGGAGGFIGVVEMVIPCPRAPNGLPTSSVNSTCFCVERRASNEGFSRGRISLSGNVTGLLSCSPPELTNAPGAASRNSPKVILTAPRASWVRTFSSGMEMTIPSGDGCKAFARNSIGIAAMIGCRGNWSSLVFPAGGAIGAAFGSGVAATGAFGPRAAVTVEYRGFGVPAALSSSKSK